jgi:HEAT repeat protein
MNLLRSQARINELLAIFVAQVRAYGAVQRTDINRVAEAVLIPIFQEVYGLLHLEDLNRTEGTNFAGLDLGDREARVAFQVTSTPTSDKVKHTLEQVVSHELYRDYDRVIVYVLTEKQRSYPTVAFSKIVSGHFDFDPKRDIIDYRDLFKEIVGLTIEKTRRVEQLLEEHFGQSGPPFWVVGSSPSGRGLDELIKTYCDNLSRKVSKVSIFGENVSRDLEKVFVRLDILDDYRLPLTNAEYLGLMDSEMRLRRNPFEYDREEIEANANDKRKVQIDPNELLQNWKHIVIVGAPGCGKTTLLRYLTCRTLNKGKYLPVFLELKTITSETFKQSQYNLADLLFSKSFASLLHVQQSERERLKQFFLARLAAGEVFIFLDGLDETRGTELFPALCNSINEFVSSDYGKSTIVISTRPYALKIRFDGFKMMEIAPLDQQKIREFLNHYYGDDLSTKGFIKFLHQHQRLRELARIPFLLAVIAHLCRAQNKIVEDRLELYRQIVLHLAITLDKEKALPISHFHIPDPDGSLKLNFLIQLAFERLFVGNISKNEGLEKQLFIFDSNVLLEKAKRFLEEELLSEINPHLLVADVKATPLLREVSADSYAFSHLTIQEYLAAVELSGHGNCEEIVCRAYFNPMVAEMEVLPMTLGLVAESNPLYIALEQLPESLTFTSFRLRARGLAYVKQLDDKILKRIFNQLFVFIKQDKGVESLYGLPIQQSFFGVDGQPLKFISEQISSLLMCSNPKIVLNIAHALSYMKIEAENITAALIQLLKKENLIYDYSDVRWAVADALGEIGGEQAVPILLDLLKGSSSGTRKFTAMALGKIGDKRADAGLVGALGDKDISVRFEAAKGLGRKGGKQALDIILNALNDHTSHLNWDAAWSLGFIGDKRAVPALARALISQDYNLRWRAAEALGRIGGRMAETTLLTALRGDDDYTRWYVARALSQIGSKRAVKGLFDAMSHENVDVRINAASSLGLTGGERAIVTLIEAMKDKNYGGRWVAARMLTDIDIGRERATSTWLNALEDENSDVRFCAVSMLGSLGGKKAIDALVRTLDDEDIFVSLNAARVLGELGVDNEKAFAITLDALQDEDEQVRWRAVLAITELGGVNAVPGLINALNDKGHSPADSSAAEGLAKLSNDILAKGLIKALDHNEPFVRRKAARAIGYYSQDVKVLRKLASLAMKDPKSDVRRAAEDARHRFGRKLWYFHQADA